MNEIKLEENNVLYKIIENYDENFQTQWFIVEKKDKTRFLFESDKNMQIFINKIGSEFSCWYVITIDDY